MAVLPLSTTFCEVTYDSDWFEDDRHLTPYRYSLLRNDSDSNSDTVSLTLPSYTYYEYLRSLYDCRTTATGRIPPGYPGSSNGRLSENTERARTWCAFGKDAGSELSRAAIRSEPTKIRPTYPFPSLHLIQGGDSGDEYDDEYAFTDRSKQKLVWVDALNKWVPETQLHPRPYMTFIGNAPMIEKTGRSFHRETFGGGGEEEEIRTCERFEMHMGKLANVPQAPLRVPNKQRNNEKREAIRKRAQELAEQRKQRKAYSTPLYTSLTERKYKKRAQSSKSANTTPTSPVQPKETSPSPRLPKEAWQPNEGEGIKVQTPPKPPPIPVKKEISITLVKAEDAETEQQQLDTAKDKMDKKVKFIEEAKPTVVDKPKSPKKKKDPDEISKEELEARLAEQRLQESLEKQRQQQILEQQRILKERELQQEKEKKEREKLEEEERLRKLKSLEKRPLSQKSNTHENYYENTMHAAGRKGKGKGKGKGQKSKTPKIDKSPSKSSKLEDIKEKKGGMKRENTLPKMNRTKAEKSLKNKLDKSKEKLLNQTTRQFKEVTQTTPRPKPVLAGMGKPPLKIPALSPRQREPIVKQEVPLPVTVPSEAKLDNVVELPVQEPKPLSAHRERRKSIVQQREIIKKERRESRKCIKKDEEVESDKLPEIETDTRKVDSWIFGDDDFSEHKSENSDKHEIQVEALPSLTQDLNPDYIEKKKEAKEKKRKTVLANLIATESTVKRWRKPTLKDSSYLDELRRMELAEERRKKQMEMFERLKNRRQSIFGYSTDDGSPSFEDSLNEPASEVQVSFEDHGFLAKYCIFTKGNIEMYRHAFDAFSTMLEDEMSCLIRFNLLPLADDFWRHAADDFMKILGQKKKLLVDDPKGGWLEGEDVMIALRGVNNRLTEAEEEYLYRVLELTGYQITHGADFKMFSVLAALSQRISALDKWMKNFIGKMDFKQLEMKMFKCKTLWECNVDQDTNCMSLDQLCVELRAGGVSLEHEIECREKLSHLPALDLLDFLTYVPLFIMIHESVVKNPLDDSRSK